VTHDTARREGGGADARACADPLQLDLEADGLGVARPDAGSNRLPILAAGIIAAHQAAHLAAQTALRDAAECGRLLIEAKALVGHGNWLPWLEQNTTVSARQSQKYMRVAQRWDELEAKTNQSSHLTLSEAVKLLADPKDEPADEPVLLDEYLEAERPLLEGEIEIAVADVRFRRELYPRIAVNQAAIRRYAKHLRDLPPIEVNQHHEIIDGFFRLEAHKAAGAATIRATVTEVANDLEHLKLACRRNSSHGLSFTEEDDEHHGRRRISPITKDESKESALQEGKRLADRVRASDAKLEDLVTQLSAVARAVRRAPPGEREHLLRAWRDLAGMDHPALAEHEP
jgi:hypothetical protein